ncbi:MAG: hypothetical protein IJD03_04730 [Clostridia bacterium]|nr:hypothetical protein [Clostridia bacterium]
MKVLFLGNSHTFFNDMPELFARFVEKTTGEKPSVTMLAYSGRELAWHRKEYFALRFNLLHGGYDYCVIQQAAHPYPPIESTMREGRDIIDLCHRCGVKPVVYMTWAERRMPENQQKMIDTCRRLALETGALLCPIGEIWQEVQLRHPSIDLYYKDGEHAGPYGDFLIAAALCRLLAGSVSESVRGMGLDFLKGLGVMMERPLVIEDKALLECGLDADKTGMILETVNEMIV